jgi:hypothetical protein
LRLSNRIYSAAFLIFCSSFLFTGCSTKQTYDYSSYRKDTGDKSINNSEAMHRATMRPYNVFGIRYYPFVANVGDQFDGIASWYGPDFHAKKTSNGEIYNMYAMTAAHKTLPMNTVVRVDNLDNGRSTIVRINDRGPNDTSVGEISVKTGNNARNGGKNSLNRLIRLFAGKKSAQIREILISESAWEEMTCLFAPSLVHIFWVTVKKLLLT